MAELEKVIKGLECCSQSDNYSRKPCKECPYNYEWRDDQGIVHLCQITQLRKDALFLLKAQEPRVIKGMKNVGSHLLGTCPSCEKILMVEEHPKFCGRCGQAVKWDG